MAAVAEEAEAISEHLMDLSNIGRIVDGSGFAYRALRCVEKHIGPLKAIEGYPHLQTVDLSNNFIKDVAPLKALQYILKLNLSTNQIVSLKSWDSEEGVFFPNLIDLDLSSNALTSLPALQMKALRTANFARNDIASSQDFKGHERLESLDLSFNRLGSLNSIAGLPVLTKLDVSSNVLATINGLASVPVLEALRLGGNKLTDLAGSWQELGSLRSLNISGNAVADVKYLEVLRSCPKLRELQVLGNPFVERLDGMWRMQVIRRHWRVEVLDSDAVLLEELEAARQFNVRCLEEERAAAKTAPNPGADE